MGWRMKDDEFCTEEGCNRPRAVGSDLCLACQQGIGLAQRRIAERDEAIPGSTPATIDLENWPVLPEDPR